MNFDDLLQRYFGTTDLTEVSAAVQESGIDRMRVDFGLERDRPRRFALWSVLTCWGRRPTSMSPSRTKRTGKRRAT